MYLGAQDLEQLLAKLASTQGSPEGTQIVVTVGKSKDGSKDQAAILVEAAQPRKGGGGAPTGGYRRQPVGYKPPVAPRQ